MWRVPYDGCAVGLHSQAWWPSCGVSEDAKASLLKYFVTRIINDGLVVGIVCCALNLMCFIVGQWDGGWRG